MLLNRVSTVPVPCCDAALQSSAVQQARARALEDASAVRKELQDQLNMEESKALQVSTGHMKIRRELDRKRRFTRPLGLPPLCPAQ